MRTDPSVALPERRATVITNEGGVASGDAKIRELFGLFGMSSAAGVEVTEDRALGVPAVWAAVNFIAGTLAGLPLNLYRRTGEGRERVRGGLARLLHDAVNDETSSFNWRKHKFERVLTGGRAFTYIERDDRRQPLAFWPLDPACVTVRRENHRTTYRYREGSGPAKDYEASEVIDLAFMLKADGLGHRGPIQANRDTIGLAIAATEWGSRFFQGGGVPPFAVTGNFQSAAALGRAADDLADAVLKAAKEKRQALTLPAGLDIKAIGANPDKAQLVELKRFLIEEVARIWQIPPVFLQDLTHGTFSNTEQQDLHFVKHTLKRWAEQFEQELNLKLFGRGERSRFAELNMDGLLRGDFKTRMEGYAAAIQNALLKPNEARRRENLPDDPQGDVLLIQGATVPLGSAPLGSEPPAPKPTGGAND